jgi:PLP dependent protein
MDTAINANIAEIKQRIAIAATRSGRDPHSVKLMAVTKTVPAARILEAVDAGITLLGENYVQEAKEKIASVEAVQKCSVARRAKTESGDVYSNTLSDDVCSATPQMSIHVPFRVFQQPQWHLIGHLQTNKAKYAVRLFDYVHSVDRLELAQELDRRAKAAHRQMNILIEVNVSGEQTKNGVPANKALDLIKNIAPLTDLSVQGLMTMAPYSDNPETSRPYFQALRGLRNDITREGIPGVQMAELSMGMTDDFEVAIEEGATIVRIGRAIFGKRQ